MHTNGPWTVWTSEQYAKFYNDDGPFHKFYIVAEDDDPDGPWHIADVPGGLEDGEEADNALLIAAAPELLEACEWMVKYSERMWHPGSDDEPRFMDRVRAAIAKAKGEQS